MTEINVPELLKAAGALQIGHFLLSSGKHSDTYVQCARLFQQPDLAAQIMAVVASQLEEVSFDLLCGPAMGGVIASYELARQLNMESVFAERQDGKMTFRRGFKINPGQRVLIVEDVVTTGKSSLECRELIESLGGKVVGIACVVNRSGRDQIEVPIFAATTLSIATYEADDVPDWLAAIPIDQPGSRFIQTKKG